jgi:hypothetical protein
MNSSIKQLKATHEGVLPINGFELNVAVLSDGTRIITEYAVFKAFGRTSRGRARYDLRVSNRPAFIDAKNLQPFVNDNIETALGVIKFKDKTGKASKGYDAVILPALCQIYLAARQANALTPQQLPLARASEALLLALSKVGITALVDEATGYQYEREADELQKILKAYIAEELLPWQKKFPDVLYKEIFRLNGWNYTVRDIKKRPSVIGKWTNKFVYEQLPKGVLADLKEKTPKSLSGNYTARFHQSLTEDIGNPHLQAQINSIIPLMQVSDSWQQFVQNFNKMVERRNGQIEIKFEDIEYKGEPAKNRLLKSARR